MVLVGSGDSQVPAPLPTVLKEYTKSAIRTQPRDLLVWSLSYFKCLEDGRVPPVKDRLEFPVPVTSEGISPGILRVLQRQLGDTKDGNVEWASLAEACHSLGVRKNAVKESWDLTEGAKGCESKPWDHILSHLAIRNSGNNQDTNKNVSEALQHVMNALTDDSVSKRVLLQRVLDHYARIHAHIHSQDPNVDQNAVVLVHQDAQDYLTDVAQYQQGFLLPSDLTRPSCPPLQ
uniref:Ropporin-1-like protein n=2 Tax=Hirondellea gigas TaxID=1518452 RepID=A0A2P2HY65_9CRUS